MKTIIRNIFRFALKEEIDRLNRKEKELDSRISESIKHMNTFKQLLDNIDVSVDVHENSYSPSWAVISLQGQKTDYIKFIDLRDSDIRDVSFFLRRYEKLRNIKIDASPRASSFLRIKK